MTTSKPIHLHTAAKSNVSEFQGLVRKSMNFKIVQFCMCKL